MSKTVTTLLPRQQNQKSSCSMQWQPELASYSTRIFKRNWHAAFYKWNTGSFDYFCVELSECE
jgi:hypothetical protein